MAELHNPWAVAFGIIGNIISFMVYLAPVPTFIRIYRNKSTEGFQAVPYVVALFSAMLMLYYALVKTNSTLLVTINGPGCLIETLYIAVFLFYAPKRARIFTVKLLMLLNVSAYCLIVGFTFLLLKSQNRVRVIGFINVGFSVCVFVAPLSIMRLVLRTKSVEFMPFSLSFFLTLSAAVWFAYGLLIKDLFVAAPNIIGFFLGVAQMVLYIIYKGTKQVMIQFSDPEKAATQDLHKPPAPELQAVKLSSTTPCSEVHPIEPADQTTPNMENECGGGLQNRPPPPHEETDGAGGEVELGISQV